MSNENLIEGTVAFSNLTTFDVYKGRPTGKYSFVITLDNAAAAQLEAQDVRLKHYQPKNEEGEPEGEETAQRKFASKFGWETVDIDGAPFQGEMGRGTKVRVFYELKPNEEYGMIPYPKKVRVLELVEPELAAPEEF